MLTDLFIGFQESSITSSESGSIFAGANDLTLTYWCLAPFSLGHWGTYSKDYFAVSILLSMTIGIPGSSFDSKSIAC